MVKHTLTMEMILKRMLALEFLKTFYPQTNTARLMKERVKCELVYKLTFYRNFLDVIYLHASHV